MFRTPSWMPCSTSFDPAMAVEVELFGQFSVGRQARQVLEVTKGITAKEIAIRVGLNPTEVGLVSIDGVLCELEAEVPVNCRLCFFPPMTGG